MSGRPYKLILRENLTKGKNKQFSFLDLVIKCSTVITLVIVMATLWNRAGHYIFVLFLLSSFFSSPNLSGRRLDLYHTSTHGVALVRI